MRATHPKRSTNLSLPDDGAVTILCFDEAQGHDEVRLGQEVILASLAEGGLAATASHQLKLLLPNAKVEPATSGKQTSTPQN